MARKHSILIDEVPVDLKAVGERLQLLCDALGKKRDDKRIGKAEQRDWTQLLDYWQHVEVLEKERDRDVIPETDPLTLLDVAEKFNLAAPEQIAHLRTEFNRRVTAIMGEEVSPRQVRQLYKLLTTFNPARPS